MDDPESFPWLLGVARNLLRKQHQNGYRRWALADRIIALTTRQQLMAWDVAEHVVERETALAALRTLPERDLDVLVLTMWQGLTPEDAADAAGCSTASPMTRTRAGAARTWPASPRCPQDGPAGGAGPR